LFDQPTSVHSSKDLDEILRQECAVPDCEPDNDFDDTDHTKIGPAHELAAQSMMITDEQVNVPRPSRNVVRRTGAMPAVRGSGVMPQVRAEGSLNEMRDPAGEIDRDRDELGAVRAVEIFDDEPSISVVVPAVIPVAMPVETIEATPARVRRLGLIAWVVTLAVMIPGGIFGYLRIAELEQRATTAEREAAGARASAAELTRRLAATKPAMAPPVVHEADTLPCPTGTPAPPTERLDTP
jgi:hypothetical protein